LREALARDLFSTVGDELGLDRRVLKGHWDAHLSGSVDCSEGLLAAAVLIRWVRRYVLGASC
jgi:hypothetical protein